MINSKKDKIDKAIMDYEYEDAGNTDESEITDILLMEDVPDTRESTVEQKNVAEEFTYDLPANEPAAATETIAVQKQDGLLEAEVKKLQHEQQAIKQQLESCISSSERLSRQVVQIKDAGNASITSYVALSLAGLALVAAGSAILLGGSIQTDITEMSKTVASLEKRKTLASGAEELKNVNARVDQLSLKVEQTVAGVQNLENITLPLITSKKPTEQIASVNKTPIIPTANNQSVAQITLPETVKADKQPNQASINSKPLVKKESSAELVKLDNDSVNIDDAKRATQKQAQPKTDSKIASSSAHADKQLESTAQKAAVTSTKTTVASVDPKKVKSKTVKQSATADKKAKSAAAANLADNKHTESKATNKTKEKVSALKKDQPLQKQSLKDKDANPLVKKNWAVALGAYKDKTVAENQASKLRKAGVPVAVVEVKSKGETWHRLSSNAFKTRQEATDYAKEVKKTTEVSSLWITKN